MEIERFDRYVFSLVGLRRESFFTRKVTELEVYMDFGKSFGYVDEVVF